jgi:hypothetical protein
MQALLFTLVCWAALLCTGFGSSLGAVTHTLGGQLSSHAQPLQSHSGSALHTRTTCAPSSHFRSQHAPFCVLRAPVKACS